jgi:hypothetical protein
VLWHRGLRLGFMARALGVCTRTSVTMACSSPARLHKAMEGRTKNVAFVFSWAKSNFTVALRGADETKAEAEFMKNLFLALILGVCVYIYNIYIYIVILYYIYIYKLKCTQVDSV